MITLTKHRNGRWALTFALGLHTVKVAACSLSEVHSALDHSQGHHGWPKEPSEGSPCPLCRLGAGVMK